MRWDAPTFTQTMNHYKAELIHSKLIRRYVLENDFNKTTNTFSLYTL